MKDIKLIAEFCQNHNGDFETLQRMVDEAVEGGATHGKIQTIFADDLAYRDRFEKGALSADGTVKVIHRPYQSEYERLKKLELTYVEHQKFLELCTQAGLTPLTTAFNLMCVPQLVSLGFKAIKVASYDCASLPLIECLAENFDELIVSTGATFDEEIELTASCLMQAGVDFTLLHCVTLYPTPMADMNLARLEYLNTLAPRVGLSNHALTASDGVKAELCAIYRGATAIERHFTVLGSAETRDGLVSITKHHLKEIAQFSRLSSSDQALYLAEHVQERDLILGVPNRQLSHAELLNRDYYRGRFCNKLNDGRQIFNWEDDARKLWVSRGGHPK